MVDEEDDFVSGMGLRVIKYQNGYEGTRFQIRGEYNMYDI